MIIPKHLVLTAIYKNISPTSLWCEKETCHSLQHSSVDYPGQTPRRKVLVIPVLQDKSWSHHTRNFYRNNFFFWWLYTTGSLLCTAQPPCMQLHMYVHRDSQWWTCQSSVLPASIWRAVKRNFKSRAAVQLADNWSIWDSIDKMWTTVLDIPRVITCQRCLEGGTEWHKKKLCGAYFSFHARQVTLFWQFGLTQ